MTITAKVVCDSVSPDEVRLTTMVLKYPRFIHAEFMTHRVFSRNAASSRAIPVSRMIQSVKDDPAMPIHWGRNEKGMQARTELDSDFRSVAQVIWDGARLDALSRAEALEKVGAHKQVVNRILEPFMHIGVIVTATEWENFFTLRRHKDAQPEIKALADEMYTAMEKHTPTNLGYGEWHLPYVDPQNVDGAHIDWQPRISAARCARVSYMNHDGTAPDIEKDLALAERLLSSRHMSPFEHQATPLLEEWSGNLRGWKQYRKQIPGEDGRNT